jgi:hypothetical protein
VIGNSLQGALEPTLAKLPSQQSLQRCVRRYRQDLGNPAVPADDDHLFEIPEEFRMINGQQFLQYDNRDFLLQNPHLPRNRMLIFGANETARFLSQTPDWFGDGTFNIAPTQFTQLYTLSGLRNHWQVVGLYALLPNKTGVTYNSYMEQVHQIVDEHHGQEPVTFLTDYERGMLNAVEATYPNTTRKGCLFHLSSNVYKHVQHNGLVQQYNHDAVFRQNIRMLPALAFVPEDDVVNAFDEIVLHCGPAEQPILDYFEHTYVGQVRAGVRQEPLFPIELWNVSDRMEDDLPRTNNSLEGWHHAFSSSINERHPNIWKFIKILKAEDALQRRKIASITAGEEAPPMAPKYRRVNENLHNLFLDYANRAALEYLRGISYNLWDV